MKPLPAWILILTLAAMADRILFIVFPNYLIEKGFTSLQIGIVFSTAALILVLSRVFIGRFADFYGRKKLLSIGLLGQAISSAFFPFAAKIHEFVALKTVKDMSENIAASTEDAMIADTFGKKKRPNTLAKIGTSLPLGRALGAIAGFLITTYLTLSFGFFAVAFFIMLSAIILIATQEETKVRIKSIRFVMSRNIKLISVVAFLISFNYSVAYFPAFFMLAKTVGAETNFLFLMFLAANIISLPFAYSSSSWIEKAGKKKIAAMAALLFSLSILSYSFVSNIYQLFFLLILVSTAFYVWRICFKIIMMDSTTKKNRGGEIGTVKLFHGLGDVAGPVIGGIMIDFVSLQMPFILAFSSGILALMVIGIAKIR